jgi:peptidyl-prolyl cis-trans isomerase A (cyclophilin A)
LIGSILIFMTTPLVTQQIADLTVTENSPNGTFDLASTFEDPSTTGKIARFEFADHAGGGVTNVLLFDQEGVGAKATVENFVNYVEDGDYDYSIIHRSVPDFIIQGGGFAVDQGQVLELPADDPVVNEFSTDRSNLQGTIAVAKLGNDPNSGTNQWFFNLEDNSENLDHQNGGFTVFGQVLSEADLQPLEAIANLPIVNGGGAFETVPITDTSEPINTDDLVFLEQVTLVSADELSFAVTHNSNEKLVDATITDGELVLDYAPRRSGTATITLEATNLLGESVEEEFTVQVEAADF